MEGGSVAQLIKVLENHIVVLNFQDGGYFVVHVCCLFGLLQLLHTQMGKWQEVCAWSFS